MKAPRFCAILCTISVCVWKPTPYAYNCGDWATALLISTRAYLTTTGSYQLLSRIPDIWLKWLKITWHTTIRRAFWERRGTKKESRWIIRRTRHIFNSCEQYLRSMFEICFFVSPFASSYIYNLGSFFCIDISFFSLSLSLVFLFSLSCVCVCV